MLRQEELLFLLEKCGVVVEEIFRKSPSKILSLEVSDPVIEKSVKNHADSFSMTLEVTGPSSSGRGVAPPRTIVQYFEAWACRPESNSGQCSIAGSARMAVVKPQL